MRDRRPVLTAVAWGRMIRRRRTAAWAEPGRSTAEWAQADGGPPVGTPVAAMRMNQQVPDRR
jgi:hypothetical protein